MRQHYAGSQRGFLVVELLEDAAKLPEFPEQSSLADQLKLLLAMAS